MTMPAISNRTSVAHAATDAITSTSHEPGAFSSVMAGLQPAKIDKSSVKSDQGNDRADATTKRKSKAGVEDPTDPSAALAAGSNDPVAVMTPQVVPAVPANDATHVADTKATAAKHDAIASESSALQDTTALTDDQIRTLAPALLLLAEHEDKQTATNALATVAAVADGGPTSAAVSAAQTSAIDPKPAVDPAAALPATSAMLAARNPASYADASDDAKSGDKHSSDARDADDDNATPDAKVADVGAELPQGSITSHHSIVSEPSARIDNAGSVLAAGGSDRQLDLAKGNAWLDGLSRDIAATTDAGGTLRFQVAPSQLGAIAVEVKRGEDGATVTLTASSQAAHSILSDAKPQLVAQAQANGIRIAEAQVDLGGQSSGQSGGQGQSGQGSHSGAEQNRSQSSPDQSASSGFSSQTNSGSSDPRSQTRSQPLPEYGSIDAPSGRQVSAESADANRDPDGLFA